MYKERLKYLRAKHNLTQASLAKSLGIAKTTLAAYEQGKNEPNINMLKKIADYFNVSTDYLLGLTNIETPDVTLSFISNYLGLKIRSIEGLHALTISETTDKIAAQRLNTLNLLFEPHCELLSQISDYLHFTATHFKNFYDDSSNALEPISELELWDDVEKISYSDDWDMWSKALLLVIEEELIYLRQKITSHKTNIFPPATE